MDAEQIKKLGLPIEYNELLQDIDTPIGNRDLREAHHTSKIVISNLILAETHKKVAESNNKSAKAMKFLTACLVAVGVAQVFVA